METPENKESLDWFKKRRERWTNAPRPKVRSLTSPPISSTSSTTTSETASTTSSSATKTSVVPKANEPSTTKMTIGIPTSSNLTHAHESTTSFGRSGSSFDSRSVPQTNNLVSRSFPAKPPASPFSSTLPTASMASSSSSVSTRATFGGSSSGASSSSSLGVFKNIQLVPSPHETENTKNKVNAVSQATIKSSSFAFGSAAPSSSGVTSPNLAGTSLTHPLTATATTPSPFTFGVSKPAFTFKPTTTSGTGASGPTSSTSTSFSFGASTSKPATNTGSITNGVGIFKNIQLIPPASEVPETKENGKTDEQKTESATIKGNPFTFGSAACGTASTTSGNKIETVSKPTTTSSTSSTTSPFTFGSKPSTSGASTGNVIFKNIQLVSSTSDSGKVGETKTEPGVSADKNSPSAFGATSSKVAHDKSESIVKPATSSTARSEASPFTFGAKPATSGSTNGTNVFKNIQLVPSTSVAPETKDSGKTNEKKAEPHVAAATKSSPFTFGSTAPSAVIDTKSESAGKGMSIATATTTTTVAAPFSIGASKPTSAGTTSEGGVFKNIQLIPSASDSSDSKGYKEVAEKEGKPEEIDKSNPFTFGSTTTGSTATVAASTVSSIPFTFGSTVKPSGGSSVSTTATFGSTSTSSTSGGGLFKNIHMIPSSSGVTETKVEPSKSNDTSADVTETGKTNPFTFGTTSATGNSSTTMASFALGSTASGTSNTTFGSTTKPSSNGGGIFQNIQLVPSSSDFNNKSKPFTFGSSTASPTISASPFTFGSTK